MRRPVAGLPRLHAALVPPVTPTIRRLRAARHAARPPPREHRKDWERGEREMGGPERWRRARDGGARRRCWEERTGLPAVAPEE